MLGYLILFLTFVVIVVLSVLGYVVPLLLARHITRPPPGALSYFVFIGLGFLLVEAVFIQRFVLMLGYPTYSLSVVLAALLAFTGVGSWLSTKWPNERVGLLIALTVATVLIAASAFFLPNLVENMVTPIAIAGIDPSRVTIEITESTAMTDPDRTIGVLREIHDRGLKLAIDDFGTGYSSLARLKHMPVDILKIDSSFIRGVHLERDAASMVSAFT